MTERSMGNITVYGFPVSTFVNIVRLVLTEKGVPFTFCDLEAEMGSPRHLALHPFNRVPIFDHDGFVLYETAAIAAYVDDAFDGPPLQPDDPRARARMNRWISALNSYYYPYIAYHLSHERLIYPVLGIAPDEKVVAAALPKIATGLDVMENDLDPGRKFLVNDRPTLADFFMLPTMTSLSLTPEGQQMLNGKPRIAAWRAAMEALPSVMAVRAMVMPHLGKPVEHARRWVADHRPRY
jgi:glutathione S-transferase